MEITLKLRGNMLVLAPFGNNFLIEEWSRLFFFFFFGRKGSDLSFKNTMLFTISKHRIVSFLLNLAVCFILSSQSVLQMVLGKTSRYSSSLKISDRLLAMDKRLEGNVIGLYSLLGSLQSYFWINN